MHNKPSCRICGKTLRKTNKTGFCKIHRATEWRVPVDRLEDYRELTQTHRLHAQEALDIILSGQSLERIIKPTPKRNFSITSAQVIGEVSNALKISPKDIVSSGKWTHFVHARAVVAIVLHRAGLSYNQIGDRMNRDHSSVINAVRNFPKYVELNPQLAELADRWAA